MCACVSVHYTANTKSTPAIVSNEAKKRILQRSTAMISPSVRLCVLVCGLTHHGLTTLYEKETSCVWKEEMTEFSKVG